MPKISFAKFKITAIKACSTGLHKRLISKAQLLKGITFQDLAKRAIDRFGFGKQESLISQLRQQTKVQTYDEEETAKKATLLGMQQFQTLVSFKIERQLTKKVPYSFVKKHLVLPLVEKDYCVLVATCDPLNLDAHEELVYLLGKAVELAFVPKQVIVSAIHEYYHQVDDAEGIVLASKRTSDDDTFSHELEVYDLLDDARDLPGAIKLLNFSISEAIQQGASDIHFEPFENGLLIRYRIDGVLQNRLSPSLDIAPQILTRLKVMAKLDIAERRLPQDGRIKLRMGGKEIDFRVSTLPVVTGERIVLRILDKGNVVLGLDKLGMPQAILKEFRREIAYPEGIILVTGPTGSGKTTTLYSALSELQNDDTNMMTIEDPVEYRLRGIAQMGVHPKIGLTFASGLRHILRQDPDIIMVGEIRDRETAEIAIQSALTGHLVLSTLHTNDAPSAITRLVDMGIEPYLISSCCIGIMAQRLVRKICDKCKSSYKPTKQELENLQVSPNDLIENTLWKGAGCPNCLGSGFQGRHGIYELMPIQTALKKQILHSPESSQIKKVAQDLGMTTLRDHGKMLASHGITTPEEVWRVTRGSDEFDE